MVTFLVCLVVVGGAMAAILMVTMDGAIDQPATHRPQRHRRHRLHSLSSRVATYLVPTGVNAAPPRRAAGSPAAGRPPPPPIEGDAEDLRPGDEELYPGRDEAPVSGPAASAGATTVTLPVRSPPAGAPSTALRPAPSPQERAPQERAPQERPRGHPDVGRAGLLWESPAGSSGVARQTPARRALRRMRGAVALVLLLVLLGTVLALALAAFGALVAIGVRAAVGT